jgi:hypothetical protein
MISPGLYNLLLYRSFHGRADQWQVKEVDYDKLRGAFGRMSINLHLGDFLQLRPTASQSLLDDMRRREAQGGKDVPPEFQMAAKLFKETPLCFELQGTNRFKDGPQGLSMLIQFLRSPGAAIPDEVRAAWRRIVAMSEGLDPRFQEQRFQCGHMIGIYLETVGRWAMMRARRDASALRAPLFLLQAADKTSPHMPTAMAAKLMNHYNPHGTGHMHGLLAVYLGTRVRFLVAADKVNLLCKRLRASWSTSRCTRWTRI